MMRATDPLPFNPFEMGLLNVGTVIFFLAALLEVVFLVHYILVAPAFKSGIGWMFVLRSVSFLFAGFAILLGRIYGSAYPLRPYVTFALYLVVLASAVVTYWVFLHERLKGGRPRGNPRSTLHTFARRALGLRARKADRQQDEPRPITRPLKIVGEP